MSQIGFKSDDEVKTFTFLEIKAMCMISAAQVTTMLLAVGAQDNSDEMTKKFESFVEDLIKQRWDKCRYPDGVIPAVYGASYQKGDVIND